MPKHPKWTIWRYVALGLVYFLVASLTLLTTRIGNSVAIIFVANAILAAQLIASPRASWRGTLTAGGIASVVATSLFGFGIMAAPVLAAANMIEAALAAMLYRRLAGDRPVLGSLAGMALFVVAAVIVAPALSSVFGGAVSALFGGDALTNAMRWYTGHALGMLTFGPIFLLVAEGQMGAWARASNRWRKAEATALLLGVSAITAIAFSPVDRPLLFLPLLAIVVVTFRIGRLGAAASSILVALIGGYATLNGSGPIAALVDDPVERLQFFQFYLAVTVLTVLPVAAELARRKDMFVRLQESEARYRLLAEHSTDIILDVELDGTIAFASPAIRRIGGYEPAELIGRPAVDLIDPDDVPKVQAAHRRAMETPGQIESVEYRGITADGRRVWMETRTQAVCDESGRPIRAVSAIRNVEHRKALEHALAIEADTDGLTGALNRRAFLRLLEAALQSQRSCEKGCLALFDFDHFKTINDTLGHASGDRVLVDFTRLARSIVREQDAVGRIGGEEFAILLKGATWQQAQAVCERLRIACAAGITAPGLDRLVTVSAGITTLAGTAGEAMGKADEALYRAKRGGRNRLELAA